MESCRHKKSNDALKLYMTRKHHHHRHPLSFITLLLCMCNTWTMKHHFAVSRQHSQPSLKWNFKFLSSSFLFDATFKKLETKYIDFIFYSSRVFLLFCLSSNLIDKIVLHISHFIKIIAKIFIHQMLKFYKLLNDKLAITRYLN